MKRKKEINQKIICEYRDDKRKKHYWGQWKTRCYSSGFPFQQERQCESCRFMERRLT